MNDSSPPNRRIASLPGYWRIAFAFAVIGTMPGRAQVPVINIQPTGGSVTIGGHFTLSASAQGGTSQQWHRNGVDIPGATSPSLVLSDFQAGDAGVYTTTVTNSSGMIESAAAIVGVDSTAKVVGGGLEVGSNIVHPNKNVYDQVILTGPAAAITADPGQVTRVSYIDLSDDIVQVEFAGAGTLTLALDDASGPAEPLKYAQPGVVYMKGHASLIIVGADQSTNVSVFSVGKINAVNQALFPAGEVYDGIADIGSIAIASTNGQFGGIRAADAATVGVTGLTGIYAPGVTVRGPVYLGQIVAASAATPVMIFGGASDVRITGGDLAQLNLKAVQVAGITEIDFADGVTSAGAPLPAQACVASLRQNGVDVSSQLLDSIPVPLAQNVPAYPFDMRVAGISGTVTVDFLVDAKGLVQNPYAIQASRTEFVAPSVAAVSTWIFKPGRKSGRAVITHMQVPIIFALNG